MRFFYSTAPLVCAVLLAFSWTSVGLAQPEGDDPTATPSAVAETEAEAPAADPPWKDDVQGAANAGHTAWMLVSCALVLFMTAPGLAMFYGGLVRKKNVLSVMMQCVFLMGMMTVVWALYGYSLAFGGDGPYVGNDEYLLMKGVARTWNET